MTLVETISGLQANLDTALYMLNLWVKEISSAMYISLAKCN
jgi:hypothetical protein